MKRNMIKTAATTGLLLLAAFGASSAQASSPDAGWLRAVASANRCEIQAGRLAESRASDPKWKSFGQQMVTDHSAALAQVQDMATKKQVMLPGGLMSADAADVRHLSRLHGAGFDSAYKTFALKSHKKANMAYSAEVSGGKDSDVRALATKQLPVVQNHLTMVDKMTGASMANLGG